MPSDDYQNCELFRAKFTPNGLITWVNWFDSFFLSHCLHKTISMQTTNDLTIKLSNICTLKPTYVNLTEQYNKGHVFHHILLLNIKHSRYKWWDQSLHLQGKSTKLVPEDIWGQGKATKSYIRQDDCTDLMWSVKLTSTTGIKFSCHQKFDSSVPLYWSVVLISFDLHLVQVLHEALYNLQIYENNMLWLRSCPLWLLDVFHKINLFCHHIHLLVQLFSALKEH